MSADENAPITDVRVSVEDVHGERCVVIRLFELTPSGWLFDGVRCVRRPLRLSQGDVAEAERSVRATFNRCLREGWPNSAPASRGEA